MFNKGRVLVSTLVIGAILLLIAMFTVVPALVVVVNTLTYVFTSAHIWLWTDARMIWCIVGVVLSTFMVIVFADTPWHPDW